MGTCFFGGRINKYCTMSLLALTLAFSNLGGTLWAVSAQSGSIVHVVEKGETLYGISRKYGVSVDQISASNGLGKDSMIKVGQKLTIPAKTNSSTGSSGSSSSSNSGTATQVKVSTPREYTVQKGDTFYRIAKNNGISVDDLISYNKLKQDSVLKVGQVLKIPTPEQAAAILPDLPELTYEDPRSYSDKKGDSSLQWPVKKPTVTYMAGKVGGVQLSAAKNESVTVIHEGTVMFTGTYRGYGQVVLVVSKTGYMYVYAGLSTIKVQKGDSVKFGDSIGTAGTDAITGSSQICLIVYQKNSPIDPAKAPRG